MDMHTVFRSGDFRKQLDHDDLVFMSGLIQRRDQNVNRVLRGVGIVQDGDDPRVCVTRAVIMGVGILPWPLPVTVCISYFSVAVRKFHD